MADFPVCFAPVLILNENEKKKKKDKQKTLERTKLCRKNVVLLQCEHKVRFFFSFYSVYDISVFEIFSSTVGNYIVSRIAIFYYSM